MSRRAPGQGSIIELADGTFKARVSLPTTLGRKRRHRIRRAKTRQEAEAKLQELLAQVASCDNPEGLTRTIRQAVHGFIESKCYRTPATRERDLWYAKVIIDAIGKKQIGDLTVAECDELLALAADGEFGRRPIKIGSLRRIRSLLSNSLHNEMRLGNLGRNVAELSVLPAPDVGELGTIDHDEDGEEPASVRRTLSYDECVRIWNAATWPLKLVIDLCGRNGLRPSEARALRWECVDLEAMTVLVDRQLSSTNRLSRVKTKKARRTIFIDSISRDALDEWADRQSAKRRAAGAQWNDKPAFIVTTRFGTPMDAANLRRALRLTCDRAGVDRIVPYELRHTAISFQVDAGHEAWQVADWAGTSARMVEEVYRHRLDEVVPLKPATVPGIA